MSIQDEINRTKAQIGDHEAAIRLLEEHGRQLALKALGVEVGDRITVNPGGYRQFEAEVTGIRHWGSVYPRIEAVKVKKDGTAGSQSAGVISKWTKKGGQQ